MALAESSADSCSHIRMIVQPALVSFLLSIRSRLRFASSFALQYDELILGCCPCTGQECQKHPSTNTANRLLTNTMSGLTRLFPVWIARSTRNLRPRRCSADRNCSSGVVSLRRLARIVTEAAALDGLGASKILLSFKGPFMQPHPSQTSRQHTLREVAPRSLSVQVG